MRKLRFRKTLSLLLCLSMYVGFFIPAAGASDFYPENLNGEDNIWSEYTDLDAENTDLTFDVAEGTSPAEEAEEYYEIAPVWVSFQIVPIEAVVSVYPVPLDEMGLPLPEDFIMSEDLYIIEAQEDGSYLLLPGDYLMDVICEGYEPILRFPFSVGVESLVIPVEMNRLEEYDTTEQSEDFEGAAPAEGENGSEGATPADDETTSGDTISTEDETASEDATPVGGENSSEDAMPTDDETTSEDTTSAGDETTSEDATPAGAETDSENATPAGTETDSKNTTPTKDETTSGDALSDGEETISENTTPAIDKTASDSTEPLMSKTGAEEATATTEEENKPIESEGADKESSVDDERSPKTLSALSAELGEPEVLVIDSDVLVDTSMIITADRMLLVTGGTLRITQGATLQNLGCTVVSGGELCVSEGAVLENNGYLEVNENGLLTVEDGASYMAGEDAVLHLNLSAEDSVASISGIDPALMEVTLFVSDAGHLYDAIQNCGYAFTTICMDDPSLMNGLEISTVEVNVAFSLR